MLSLRGGEDEEDAVECKEWVDKVECEECFDSVECKDSEECKDSVGFFVDGGVGICVGFR